MSPTNGPGPLVTRSPADHRPSQSRNATRIGSAGGPLSASRIPIPSGPSKEALADPDDPGEYTYLIVTNGIWNDYQDAQIRAVWFAALARTQRRFKNDWTTTVLHYNRTRSVEMREWDAAHPCSASTVGLGWSVARLMAKAVEFAYCQGVRFDMWVTTKDLVESYRLREAAKYNLPVSHLETQQLTDKIRQIRAQWNSHAILIEHSEGTIIGAKALQDLPAAEGHPLNIANRCVAVLALAPAVPRASFGLDDDHLKGMIAEHDILRLTGISNASEWQSITTVLGDSVTAAMAAEPQRATIIELSAAAYVHQVGEYMRGPGRALFLNYLTTLHKECVAGSGTLTLTPSTILVGSTTQLEIHVQNQNGRELFGRKKNPGYDSRMLERIDSVTFLAYEPRDLVAQMSWNVAWNLTLRSSFTIPLVPVSFTLASKDSVWWNVIEANNGGLGSPIPGPVPTGGSCDEVRRVDGEGSSYVIYKASCATLYHVDYSAPPTLASGLQIRDDYVVWTYLDGTHSGGKDSACGGAQPCLESVRVELVDAFGNIVGRTVKAVP
jgi:hypothetical protein